MGAEIIELLWNMLILWLPKNSRAMDEKCWDFKSLKILEIFIKNVFVKNATEIIYFIRNVELLMRNIEVIDDKNVQVYNEKCWAFDYLKLFDENYSDFNFRIFFFTRT